MNNKKRLKLVSAFSILRDTNDAISNVIEKANDLIHRASDIVDDVCGDESSCLSNMPPNSQLNALKARGNRGIVF